MSWSNYCSVYRKYSKNLRLAAKEHADNFLTYPLLKIFIQRYDEEHNYNPINIEHEMMFWLGMVQGKNLKFDDVSELVEHYIEKYDNLHDLLKCNVNIDVEYDELHSSANNTLLIQATRYGDIKFIKKLIDARCALDKEVDGGRTALIIASSDGNIEIIEMLVAAGCDIDHNDCYGDTALMNAIFNERISAAKKLINLRCNINKRGDHGDTALIQASTYGYQDIVECLINVGCALNIKNILGHTALMDASHNGHIHVVEKLINARCDLNIKCGLKGNEETAFTLAYEKGHFKIAKKLIDGKCSLDISDKKLKNICQTAIEKGHQQIIDLLMAAKKK